MCYLLPVSATLALLKNKCVKFPWRNRQAFPKDLLFSCCYGLARSRQFAAQLEGTAVARSA